MHVSTRNPNHLRLACFAVWGYNKEVEQKSDYTTSGETATKGVVTGEIVTSAVK